MRTFKSYNTRNIILRDNLRRYLKEQGIYYELSEYGRGWHFEIQVTPEETQEIEARIEIWLFDATF